MKLALRPRLRLGLAPFAAVLSLAAALSVTNDAAAHTLLVSPPPISPVDSAKAGPCGCKFGAAPACPDNYTTTTLTAGDAVLIKWKETILHTGKFRLAFSSKAPNQVTDADFEGSILYDKTDENEVKGGTISTTLIVPNTPCDPCTIQLRQLMTGSQDPYYYSCASVRIVEPPAASSSSSAASGSGAGGSISGGAGGAGGLGSGVGGDFDGFGGSTGPGLATPPTPIQTASCSAGGSQGGASSLVAGLALALAGLFARTRETRGAQLDRKRRRH